MSTVASDFLQAEADLKKAHDRTVKAERTKDVGEPIQLKGKVIRMVVRDQEAWTVGSDAVARRVDLKSGKTLQVYYGHSAPVTCLAFYTTKLSVIGASSRTFLITGSWDKTIKIWDTTTRKIVGSTTAHDDFVKCLLVVPSLNILVSSSSDKTVRLWDTSNIETFNNRITTSEPFELYQIGSLGGHTRPVECMAFETNAITGETTLYTGDSMGLINVWALDVAFRNDGTRNVRGALQKELRGHRTGVGQMWVDKGRVWSGSTDCTVMIQSPSPPPSTSTNTSSKPIPTPTITHPAVVRALLPLSLTPLADFLSASNQSVDILLTGSGDLISIFDTSSFSDPDNGNGEAELVARVDVHSHDVTALDVWLRTFNVGEEGGKERKEAWIVSASLDGTLRRWKLADLISGTYTKLTPPPGAAPPPIVQIPAPLTKSLLTAEEEAELAELMGSDDE